MISLKFELFATVLRNMGYSVTCTVRRAVTVRPVFPQLPEFPNRALSIPEFEHYATQLMGVAFRRSPTIIVRQALVWECKWWWVRPTIFARFAASRNQIAELACSGMQEPKF